MHPRSSLQILRFRAVSSCLIAVCGLLNCASAMADDKGTTQIPPAPKGVHHAGRVKEVKSRASDGQGIQEVKKAPEMPGVPLPSSKFIWGFDNPTRTGRNMGARFQVPESGMTVISHYRDLLKGSGWKINDEASGAKRLFATNDRYRAAITIAVMGSTKTGGSEVDFTYGCPR